MTGGGAVMYRRRCGERVEVGRMCRPYLLAAVRVVRRRLMDGEGSEEERAEDSRALREMVAVADRNGWGRARTQVRMTKSE